MVTRKARLWPTSWFRKYSRRYRSVSQLFTTTPRQPSPSPRAVSRGSARNKQPRGKPASERHPPAFRRVRDGRLLVLVQVFQAITAPGSIDYAKAARSRQQTLAGCVTRVRPRRKSARQGDVFPTGSHARLSICLFILQPALSPTTPRRDERASGIMGLVQRRTLAFYFLRSASRFIVFPGTRLTTSSSSPFLFASDPLLLLCHRFTTSCSWSNNASSRFSDQDGEIEHSEIIRGFDLCVYRVVTK